MSLFLIILILIWGASAEAAIVKYKDSKGNIWYVNRMESIPQQYQDQIQDKINLLSQDKRDRPSPDNYRRSLGEINPAFHQERQTPNKQQEVEIFVTSWCTYCKQLESFLNAQRINFRKYDIERDTQGKRKYDAIGLQGVPVIKIGTKTHAGFSQDWILTNLRN